MEELFKMLGDIYDLLEQINAITTNQTTVLLQSSTTIEEKNNALDLLEDMVNYKEEFMNQLLSKEECFDNAYSKYKGKITDPTYVKMFKEWVERIMAKKQEIVEAEKNNVVVMQNISKKTIERVAIPKDAKEVTMAYKKQQTNKAITE